MKLRHTFRSASILHLSSHFMKKGCGREKGEMERNRGKQGQLKYLPFNHLNNYKQQRQSLCPKNYPSQIVKTQRNSTQLNPTQSNCKSNFVELDSVVTWNPPHPHHTTPNFSGTSRPARELKFGTDTH